MNPFAKRYQAAVQQANSTRYSVQLLAQLNNDGLPNPEREWRFHHDRKWRFDIAYPELKLAIEIEGGAWLNGRHNRALGFESDCMKYNEALIMGWNVLRVTPKMILDGRAVDQVKRAWANYLSRRNVA